MLKATLFTAIFSFATSRVRAILAIAGLTVLTLAEGAYIALHHHQSFMHGLRAFGVLQVYGQAAYFLAAVLLF